MSDFIDKHNRLLFFTDEEYEQAKQVKPLAKKYTHQFLDYDKKLLDTRQVVSQMKTAVEMA